MGSPQQPTAAQQQQLQEAGQLQLLAPPLAVELKSGALQMDFDLPIQGISLLQLSW